MDSICPAHRVEYKRIGMADGADAAEQWLGVLAEGTNHGT
jgi:hypothetical protein